MNMDMNMNMADILGTSAVVLCVSGPSGVGKGTVIQELCRLYPQLKVSISATTRPPRGAEKEAVDYYYRSHAQFEKMIQDGQILEYDEYCGNYYGTPRAAVEEAIRTGQDMILDVTVKGSLAVQENFPRAITVFLLPPSLEELARRLAGRGTEERSVVEKRLDFAKAEMKQAKHFAYVLVNETVRETAEQLWHIVEAERHRTDRNPGIEECLKSL